MKTKRELRPGDVVKSLCHRRSMRIAGIQATMFGLPAKALCEWRGKDGKRHSGLVAAEILVREDDR